MLITFARNQVTKLMEGKKEVLKKIKILISQQFETPEAALNFFDKNADGHLEYGEIKNLIKKAEVSKFISGLAASKILEGMDKDDDEKLNWVEFKEATKSLLA